MWEGLAGKFGWEAVKAGVRKLRGAFGGPKVKMRERELHLPGGVTYRETLKEIPISKEVSTFVNAGAESILTSPATAEPMSKVLAQAGAKELEKPEVRNEEIKQREDAQRLLETPQVKALTEEGKLRFAVFAFIVYGDKSFHGDAFPEAEKAYREACEFAQELGDESLLGACLYLIGAAIGMQGDDEAALPYLDEATKHNPRLASAWYDKGLTLYGLGRYEEATASYDTAIQLEPDFAEAWTNKGAILCDEFDQKEEAISCFDKALAAKPNLVQAWNNKGVALANLGRHEEALAYYDEALKHNPEYAWAWTNKGRALGDLGRYEEALPFFDEAIKLMPEDAEAWFNKGLVLADFGRHEEAVACFEEALTIKPDDANAWYNKGRALHKLGRYEEALTCYDEAIKHEPDYAEAWNNKGAILCDHLSEIEEAISCFDEALAAKPNLAQALSGKGIALTKLKRYEEAKGVVKRALPLREQLSDKGAVVFYILARLILLQGLESIESKDMKKAEERALELIQLTKEAEKDDLAEEVEKKVAEFKTKLSKKELKLFNKFEKIIAEVESHD